MWRYNFYVEQGKQIQKDNQDLLDYLKKKGAQGEYNKIVANGGVTSPLRSVPTFSPTAGGKGTGGSHGGGNGGSHGETDLMKKEREKLEKKAERKK